MSKIATLNQIGSAALTGKAYTDARLDAFALADLADAKQAASAADGSILIRQNGQWVPASAASFKGEKGDKGDTGATGPQGPQGVPGATTLTGLTDANVPANAANGSLLSKQGGKWTAVPVATAIGGKPAYTQDLGSGVLYGAANGDTVLQFNNSGGLNRHVAFYKGRVIVNTLESATSNWVGETYLPESDTGWQYYTSDYFDFMYRKKNGIVSIVCNGQIKQNVSTDALQLNVAMPEGYRPDTSYIPAIFSIRSSKQAMCVFFGQDGSIWAEINGAQAGQIIVGSVSYTAA